MDKQSRIEEIIEKYNGTDINGIYAMLAENAQKALTLPALDFFFKSMFQNNGKIVGNSIITDSSRESVSKVYFQKNELIMNLTFDSRLLIEKMLFTKPETSFEKPAVIAQTEFILPFRDQWHVLWGGDSHELNYHHTNPAQKYAFDFLITNIAKRSYESTGNQNEDYYSFGKEIFSPLDGIVEWKVDGIIDNQPGKTNKYYIPGNSMMIRANDIEFCFLAHFRLNSIAVERGQRIKKGDFLGFCGNSGNSTEPHLHMHVQSSPDLADAVGIKFHFNSLFVNGKVQKLYSPVKSETVSNGLANFNQT